jgi:molybdenum cofactor cytidylyltransferase
VPRPTPEAEPGRPRSGRVAGLVLAAGAATRFGSPKALALIYGRPMLEPVLAAAAAGMLEPVVVVLGDAGDRVEAAVRWRHELRVRNPDPGRGLASSLRVGLEAVAALRPPVDAVVILLGDQPRVRPDVIAALLARHASSHRPIVVPRYAGGGGPNPVVLARSTFDLAAQLYGDRGLGPLITARRELVDVVDVAGMNPDVDTPADLAGLG